MTKEDFVILSQLLDEKFEPVYTRLDVIESDVKELKQDVATLEQKVTTLEQKVTTLEQKVTTLEQKVTTLEQKITTLEQKVTTLEQKVTTIEQKVAALEDSVSELNQRVSSLELTIENETNVNIKRIAEGHCDLVRNLREARKVDDEKELLAIRVTVLESDMSKVKNKLAIV